MRRLEFLICCVFLLSLVGCAPQKRELAKICFGPADINELIRDLGKSSPTPFRASGTSQLIYADVEGKKRKERKERVDVKIWVNPPFDIYLQGDVAFDPRGLILGANADEFWLALRPNEIDSFYSGRWDDAQDGFVAASAGILLESLGEVNFADPNEWKMAVSEKFTILAKCRKMEIIKSLIIYNCDRRIRRINYFDNKGELAASAEIDDYQRLSDNFFVPHTIKLIGRIGANFELTLKLGGVKTTQFSEQQSEIMFNPPDSSGYKNVYRVIGDKLV